MVGRCLAALHVRHFLAARGRTSSAAPATINFSPSEGADKWKRRPRRFTSYLVTSIISHAPSSVVSSVSLCVESAGDATHVSDPRQTCMKQRKKNALSVVIISDWWHFLISKNIKTQRLYLLEFRSGAPHLCPSPCHTSSGGQYCKARLYCPTCSIWTVMVFLERPTRPY